MYSARGQIAIRDNRVIDINADSKLVTSEGRSPEKVIDVMEELMSIARRKFPVNFKKEPLYLELTASLIVTSEKNPLRSLAKFSKKHASLKKFDDLSPFLLRLERPRLVFTSPSSS